MKDKIMIVNWLLTRRCNLSCDYCGIVRNIQGKPQSYPKMKHYVKQEMSTEYVIETLKRLKKHNPNAFMIFYGGEPFLRKDLHMIVNFCNDNDIHYTIITNNSDAIQPAIEKFMSKVDHVKGFTSSIDPLILNDESKSDTDRYKKCIAGLERLQKYKGVINDLVAEITVDDTNIDHLYPLVKMLTEKGINSDITTIDIAKNKFYDFSNITSMNGLVHKTDKVKDIFNKIIEDKLDVHMADTLLPKIWDILPANLDCGIQDNVHNMTIDADGSVRLCLRIRGIMTPNMKAYDCFLSDSYELHPSYKKMIFLDKVNHCQGCNWTCMLHSKLTSDNPDLLNDLLHKERRDG